MTIHCKVFILGDMREVCAHIIISLTKGFALKTGLYSHRTAVGPVLKGLNCKTNICHVELQSEDEGMRWKFETA